MKLYNVFILSFLLLTGCGKSKNEVYKINGFTMGTTYSITVVKNSKKEHSFDLLKTKIDSVLAEVNNKMSTYQKDSELSLFNESSSTDWYLMSDDLFNVVKTARKISEETSSAYDISVGPIVNLWGFGPEARPIKMPTEKEILERRDYVGLSKYQLDDNSSKIKKAHKDLYIDLSSIAKGFGVDEVGRLLSSLSYTNYMVEVGGEVFVKGKNQSGTKWNIGISVPDGSNEIQRIVSISGNALATSGDYRNYFEENGVRYSHTIDARTGKPITHKLVSVSVISDDCMNADGWATALNVIGAEEGRKIAENNNMAVLFIVKEGNLFKEIMTDEFKKYLAGRNK